MRSETRVVTHVTSVLTPRWDHDPFLGATVLEDGKEFVFGRGAIDDKHSLMGILQASATYRVLTSSNRNQYSQFTYAGAGVHAC